MTDRERYLVLRDFHVWFSKHRGFFEALRRSEPGYVRAVDGIDLSIGKGEIYCLVGESGCGKTTTGKGILQLVPPTRGDVLLKPSDEEVVAYDAATAGHDEATLGRIREERSLTYKEDVQRTALDYLRHILLVVVGAAVGIGAAIGLILGLRLIGGGGLEPLAYVAVGAAIAFFGTARFVKMSRGVPYALLVAAIVSAIPVQIAALALGQRAGSPMDLISVLGNYGYFMQNNSLFLAVIQWALAAGAAWVLCGPFNHFWGGTLGAETDRLRKLRTRLQMIFQDPYESLNPRHTVYDIVAEPLLVNRITRSRAETEARVEQALNDAGLRPAKDYLLRFPHEMSGGQRQRVGIAGALVLEPEFLVADEPVSMLDVSIRTEIIELLLDLRRKRNLTYLFITHDLSLAYVLADRIGVMYLGKIVEEGPTEQLIVNPQHPYTKALISVVPIPDPDIKHERTILRGERPNASDIPAGCRFHPRCPVAFEKCGWTSDEVLGSLREAAQGDGAVYLQGAVQEGPGSIRCPAAPTDFETWLRGLIAEKAETVRGLKAIEAVERVGSGATIRLRGFEEPVLRSAASGVLVSCHLYA